MDQKAQSSFIPRKPTGETSFARPYRHEPKGVLYIMGLILFLVSLIGAGAVFGYEKYLGGQIAKMESSLAAARESLDPNLIKELSRSHARMMSAQEILSKHTAITTFFSLLESLTLQSLRYTSFSFSSLGDKGVLVKMSGEARDYKTVALQNKIFSENSFIKNSLFSGLDLSDDGNVTFDFQANLDGNLLLYERGFESVPVNNSAAGSTSQ